MQIGTSPKIIEIVAGPNGSGRTTFAEAYFLRTKRNPVFLNPDLIASGIAPLDFEKASFQAGRILISQIKERIGQGQSFSVESALSGRPPAVVNKVPYSQHFLFRDLSQRER